DRVRVALAGRTGPGVRDGVAVRVDRARRAPADAVPARAEVQDRGERRLRAVATPDRPRVRRGVELDPQVGLDLRRVVPACRAARADAAGDAGHQLLAVQEVLVGPVPPLRLARPPQLDRTEPGEVPAGPGEPVPSRGGIRQRELRLEAVVGRYLDRDRIRVA